MLLDRVWKKVKKQTTINSRAIRLHYACTLWDSPTCMPKSYWKFQQISSYIYTIWLTNNYFLYKTEISNFQICTNVIKYYKKYWSFSEWQIKDQWNVPPENMFEHSDSCVKSIWKTSFSGCSRSCASLYNNLSWEPTPKTNFCAFRK